MIMGIGVDLIGNQRLVSWLRKPKLLDKYFTERELRDVWASPYPQASLAARFAAKEAFSKASGMGLQCFKLKDIQIVRRGQGQPWLELYGEARDWAMKKKVSSIHLSLTHEKEYSVAFVILEIA